MYGEHEKEYECSNIDFKRSVPKYSMDFFSQLPPLLLSLILAEVTLN